MDAKKIIAVIAVIAILGAAMFVFTNMMGTSSIDIEANGLEDKGSIIVDADSLNENNVLYHTESSDVNGILIKNGGLLKLDNSMVKKEGDTSSTGDAADFYGINSAILVNTNGTLDISNTKIETNSTGSNGIFVTNAEASSTESGDSAQGGGEGGQPPEMPNGEGGQPPEAAGGEGGQPPEMPSGEGGQAPDGNGGGQPGQTTIEGTTEANIDNVEITTHADKSRGLDATYNGKIHADNIKINTDGQSCAALATDRGEGEVHVDNSEINTGVSKQSGRGSPLIYSTGNITLDNTKGTAYVSQIACIEGKNSIELDNCELTGYGGGNRQDGDTYVDLAGIFIYQSMSGDADVGTATFDCDNTKLKIAEDSPVYTTAPMFHITNTACVINLENTECTFGSGVFLESSGQNQWGTEGSNGGICELNTNNEEIDGDVIVDSISSLNWNMKNTKFNGAINSTGNATVNVGEGSTWTLTGDSSVSSLSVSGNIEYGNYTLTVNGKTYNSSNPFKG